MRTALKKYRFSISFMLVVFCTSTIGIAQNLVPNSSFENFSQCPSDTRQLTYATGWIGPTNNNSDYYNSCSTEGLVSVPVNDSPYGFQWANSGNAYAGVWLYQIGGNYREYLQATLSSSLSPNACYKVQFYANLKNIMTHGIRNISAHFSDTAFPTASTSYLLPLESHVSKFNKPFIVDTLNWVEITGMYVAKGGEKFITLGNFNSDSNTDTISNVGGFFTGAYYYIDDVSVINISDLGGMPANAGPDVSVAPGDSVFIGQDISNLNCTWSVLGGGVIASNVSGIYVKPTVMTTYVVEQTLCGVTSTDTVNVYLTNGLSDGYSNARIAVFPNPASTSIIVRSSYDNTLLTYRLTDLQGKEIEVNFTSKSNFEMELDLSKLRKSMYLLTITNTENHESEVFKLLVQP